MPNEGECEVSHPAPLLGGNRGVNYSLFGRYGMAIREIRQLSQADSLTGIIAWRQQDPPDTLLFVDGYQALPPGRDDLSFPPPLPMRPGPSFRNGAEKKSVKGAPTWREAWPLRAAARFGDEAPSRFRNWDRVGVRRVEREDRGAVRLTTTIAVEMLVVMKMR